MMSPDYMNWTTAMYSDRAMSTETYFDPLSYWNDGSVYTGGQLCLVEQSHELVILCIESEGDIMNYTCLCPLIPESKPFTVKMVVKYSRAYTKFDKRKFLFVLKYDIFRSGLFNLNGEMAPANVRLSFNGMVTRWLHAPGISHSLFHAKPDRISFNFFDLKDYQRG